MKPTVERFLRYLQFKGECMAYQQDNPVRVDMPRVLRNIKELEALEQEKIEHLKVVMPKKPVYKEKKRPAKTHKKDMTLTAYGEKWFKFLRENKLPMTHNEPVKYVDSYEEPNPGSSDQVKSWLFSLGWEPCTYKYVKDDDGTERAIPQVRKDGELTRSVEMLVEREPELEHLANLTVIQHRLSIFRNFRDMATEVDGSFFLVAAIGGLTNTLRFKHKNPLVNLPGVEKPWGEEIRGSLMAPDGFETMGADMVSLEATTKAHYIYDYDPDYAEELTKPDFDEHLDLAKRTGEVTQEDIDYYKSANDETTERFKLIHSIRKKFKPVNYSAIYGVGAKKLVRETGYTFKVAVALLKAYWKRNWAVRELVKPLKVKEVGGYNWLQNPVSGFWYELRYDKDRFSTLNQGTGVYIFDSWLVRCAANGYYGNAQFHDETLGFSPIGQREATSRKLKDAIKKLNEDLPLNVTMAIDIKYGGSYADVH